MLTDILDEDFHPLPLAGDEEDPDDTILKLSPSTIAGFLQDPALYYYSKVLKRPKVENLNLVVGSTVHAGIEHGLGCVLAGRPMPSITDCLIAAQAVWLKKTSEMMPEPGLPFEQQWLAIQNGQFPLIYEMMLGLKPEGVEQYVRRQHPSGKFDLHGYIDLVHSGGVITDFKTAAKSPSKNKATGRVLISNMHRLQLVYYAWLVSGGERDVDVEIRTIVKTKAPKIVLAQATITPAEMIKRLEVAEKVYDAIKGGVFPPNYGNWMCSPNKCPFFNECHGNFGDPDDGGDES